MASFATDHMDVIEQLSERSIRAALQELETRDVLTLALREALQNGVSVDELSAICGLTPGEIRRRCEWNLNVLSELETLTG